MSKILVSGGNGMLGRHVVRQLLAQGHTVRAMSRKPHQREDAVEWVQANLTTRTGLAEAVMGIDTIIHLASLPRLTGKQADRDEPSNADIYGTRAMLEHARAANVQHCIYVSIVGVERVPMPHYRQKLATERVLRESGVGWSIVRATQFHPFIATFLRLFAALPIFPFPADLPFQPVATEDVAAYLCRWANAGPSGLVAGIGGPQVLTAREMMQAWLQANNLHRKLIPVRWPGQIAAAIRAGGLLCPDGEHGTGTWAQWVQEQVARQHKGQPIETYSLRR